MIEPRPHTTAWYKMMTAKLNERRVNLLLIESYYCHKRLSKKPKPGVLIFRHVEPFVTIAMDLRYGKFK